jgi:hypothetical protein
MAPHTSSSSAESVEDIAAAAMAKRPRTVLFGCLRDAPGRENEAINLT